MKKFLCDHMCIELGRWLRAAGYDTAIINDAMPDRDIYIQAVQEKRRLLTRDRHFKEIDPDKIVVIFLREESLDSWARQLKNEEGVDWLYRPFSRCLVCNSELEITYATKDIPKGVLEYNTEFWVCPSCQKTYWKGSHAKRMLDKLSVWAGTGD